MMDKLSFKKDFTAGLYSFLHVDNTSYSSLNAIKNQHTGTVSKNGIRDDVYMQTFYDYLALSEFLCEKRNKYCLMAFYPEKNKVGLNEICAPHWHYSMLSDDSNGLGIDNGFISNTDLLANEGNSREQRLYGLDRFLSLNRMPEETFGEAVSQCSLFGLKNERAAHLQDALHSPEKPKIEDLLEDHDIFIHMVVAKEIGYYNTLLIKSSKDIESTINSFLNILDPGN